MVTLCSLGLDFPRGVLYGALGFLAPVGYGRCRDPDGMPLGISLLPGHHKADADGGDRSPEQVDALRERSRHYLAMHLILGGGVLGISCAILGLLINFTTVFEPLSEWIIFNHQQVRLIRQCQCVNCNRQV